MTTINCSSNCIHQVDGKCTLDIVSKNSASVKSNCIFFEEKVFKKSQKKVI
ncbi:MAG TPA: hydroxymyristoyl-ACP dehydratase [Ruminiclostridium sp.]|uniref:hydroxymyristoyl-ACP dehydratase n=1 Tax=Acetivibrio saccincola TaxID=1677857 RepID=UPI000C6D31AB|nr:hydroxymyristoyl-ACP dehydratase [Acetivibrio saccincola]HAA43772.1 hydroxymyristoyl-ACP dehydratase [Ruminiclostridium sp.]HOA97119.1 hydroxymyristoyl-ACP dehydratase [Acetivibrio saccincola]